MCEFKSAIITRTGKLYHSPWTDSHEDLITLFDLNDNREGSLCRVEFKPPKPEDLDKPDKYKFKIDEERTPDWFTERKQERAADELRGIIQRMIIDKPVKLLYGGAHIVTNGATIEAANHMRIVFICGGTVSAICGGTVSAICGGTVSAIYGGTVSAICGGTVSAICGGTVSAICGGTVSEIRGGTVSAIRGGTVSAIWGGTVSEIWGGTVINDYRKK